MDILFISGYLRESSIFNALGTNLVLLMNIEINDHFILHHLIQKSNTFDIILTVN